MNRVIPSQVKFLFKPTQSRKTQHTITQILESHGEDPKTFFVYICHNISASLTQTTCRIQEEITKHFKNKLINPKILKFLSSGETSEDVTFVNNHHMACSVLSQSPEDYIGLFVLAHPIRFKFNHIDSIIKTINNIQNYSRIHIYFDEFDRYSKLIVPTIDRFCSLKKVELYELISATAADSKILKEYGDIPYENIIDLWDEGSYDPEFYVTYEEQIKNKNFFVFDRHEDALIAESLLHFFDLNPENENEFYGFIPAHNKKSTHFDVATTIMKLKFGISVCIINSDFKGLILPDGEQYEFDISSKEILDIIIEAKIKLNIRKLIITGNGCVGRSVTLQGKHSKTNDVLIFDFAIYDDKVVTNGDSAYQLDRTKGNIKKFSSKYPITYCTPKFKRWVISREKIAMIGSNEDRVSFKTHQQKVKEDMIIPTSTKVLTFEDELDLDTNEKCKNFLKSKNLNAIKSVRPLEKDEETGKFKCSFEGSLAVLDYDTHISVFRNFSPVAKYHKNHLMKLENDANENDCLFFRWVLYKDNTPYYFIKCLVKT